MATNNSWNSNIPVVVAQGGTGQVTLTDHGVLVGSGTAAVDALAVGTTGQLLVGATGADPAFGTTIDNNISIQGSAPASSRQLVIRNTDNTPATVSNARLNLVVDPASIGDSYVSLQVDSTTIYSLGIDNSDSDKLKLTNDSAGPSSGSVFWNMTTAGERTMPLQPAFLAYLPSSVTNATGDGTSFTLGSGTALTEVFDQGGDFVTSGTFTAPITARYNLTGGIIINALGALHTAGSIDIVTSNRNYSCMFNNAGAVKDSGSRSGYVASSLCDMDAGDTATLTIFVSGSTKTVGLFGDSYCRSYFSGFLAC